MEGQTRQSFLAPPTTGSSGCVANAGVEGAVVGATVTVTVIITIHRQQQQQQQQQREQERIDTIWRRKTSHNTPPFSRPAAAVWRPLSLSLPLSAASPNRAHRKTKQAPDARFNQQQMRPATERGGE